MNQNLKKDLPSYIIATILFAIVVYKAITISMTHDESASFNYFNHKDVIYYLFDSNVWSNANNHWLNTLSFQLSTRIFGPTAWAIRLGSVSSFLLYAWYSIQLLKGVKTSSFRMLGLLLLLANPYVLDFFSVARGYGMSMAFTTGALFYSKRYLEDEKLKFLVKALVFLLLATLSLFSAIIFFPAMMGSVVLVLMIRNKSNPFNSKVLKTIAIIAISLIIALILTYIPIKTLSANAEFKWGTPSLIECFRSMVWHSSYGKVNKPFDYVIVGALTCFVLLAGIRTITYLKSKKIATSRSVPLLALLTLVFLVIGIFLSKQTLGTYYPLNRKTIMFVPYIGLILTYWLDSFKLNRMHIVGWICCLGLIIHFNNSLNYKVIREWWYDSITKSFIGQIVDDASKEKVSIGCHWMFHPTLTFYSKVEYSKKTRVMGYSKSLETKSDFDYFVCFNSDYPLLKDKYDVLYDPPNGRMILKLKDK